MWLSSLRRLILGKSRSPQVRHGRSKRPRFVPRLDYLEERIALSPITVGASDTAGLISAINQANTDSQSGIADTINLTSSTYSITGANNTTNGANALPVITATNLTINGNGATIDGAFLARLFDLGSGAGVTLENLTLTGGTASGANAQGGAIYDAGNNLTLQSVAVTSNSAFASGQTTNGAGNSAQGGGLYLSGGTVHLTNSNITDNGATGAQGAAGAAGGTAQGGGIYANGATLIVSGGSVKDQTIKGGSGGGGTTNNPTGGAGGSAQGGGIFAQGGKITLSNGAAVAVNTVNGRVGASGGTGGAGGDADGGGVYASNAVVVINSGANVINNSLFGGGGGAGNASGQGGSGGQALGGAVFVEGGSANISASAYLNDNAARGGIGGTGGSAGAGGEGGAAAGGGLYVVAAPLTLTSGSGTFSPTSQSGGVLLNSVFGGDGGHGGGANASGSGNGGAGGSAQGGGVFASGSNLAVILGNATTAAAIDLNTAIGGNGGAAGMGGGVGGNAGSVTGGGASVLGDELTMTNATIYGNTAIGGNGGNGEISASGYVVSTFGNGGNAQGGGLFVSGSSSVTVLNSTVADQAVIGGGGTAGGVAKAGVPYGVGGTAQGGGLDAVSSTVSVLNSTVADNGIDAGTGSAPSTAAATGKQTAQGGGLYAANGSLTLINDTIAWNDVATFTDAGQIFGQGGGVYNASTNTLQLANTIIALNQLYSQYYDGGTQYGSPSDSENDLYGIAASSDHDFIGDGSGSNLTNGTNGDQVGSDSALLDPQFAPALTTNSFGKLGSISGQMPANYGGLTYTLPLTASSSAVNAGDASTSAGSPVALIAAAEKVSTANATDQRGMARVINGDIDIGATQSGLQLSGSAPATVQAGQDITYTFTISNNGPSDLSNVTLSDPLPANTTFVSLTAPAGWTTSTPSAGGTGTVTANLGTLAADTTATFTLTVLVGSGAQGTSVVNNASVTYSGTANPVSSNLTLSTSVPGSSVNNITNEVRLIETPIVRDPFAAPGTYVQAALFINESGAAINGPIALVLNGLPAGVTVTNADGTTNGSPYINIEPPGGTWQPGVRYFLFAVIMFSDPTHVKITYTPEVVQGL